MFPSTPVPDFLEARQTMERAQQRMRDMFAESDRHLAFIESVKRITDGLEKLHYCMLELLSHPFLNRFVINMLDRFDVSLINTHNVIMNKLHRKPTTLFPLRGKVLLPNIHAGDPELRGKFEMFVRVYEELVYRVISYMRELLPTIKRLVGNEFLRSSFQQFHFLMGEVYKYFITRLPPSTSAPQPVPMRASKQQRW